MDNTEAVIEQTQQQEQNHNTPEKVKKKMWKSIMNIVLVLGLTVLAIVLTITDNAAEIWKQLMTCDWRYLFIAFGILIAALLIRSFVVLCFARLYTRKYHLHQAVAVDYVGTFYNAVTPGASGGQVMQAYTLKKQGIPISSAVSMLAMSSIIFQIVLICYGLAAFILKNNLIMEIGVAHLGQIGDWNIDIPIWVLTIIGFLLNVGVILLILLMGYWRKFHNFIMGPMITLLTKIHLCKKPDKARENLKVQVENFKVEMRRLFSNIPFTLLITVLYFVYFAIRYSAPYFIGLALGNQSNIASFWDCVLLSNFHQMITGIVPIPGSAGVSELVFRLLFVNNNATSYNSFFFVDAAGADPTLIIAKIDYWLEAHATDPTKYVQEYEIYFEYGYGGLMDAATGAVNTEHSAAMANAALLLWRSITFIIPVFIAGLVTAFYHGSPKEEVQNVPNRQTFINLQRDTYVARKEDLDTMMETARLTREEILNRLKEIGNFNKRKRQKKKEEEDRKKYPNHNRGYDKVDIDEEDDSIR